MARALPKMEYSRIIDSRARSVRQKSERDEGNERKLKQYLYYNILYIIVYKSIIHIIVYVYTACACACGLYGASESKARRAA